MLVVVVRSTRRASDLASGSSCHTQLRVLWVVAHVGRLSAKLLSVALVVGFTSDTQLGISGAAMSKLFARHIVFPESSKWSGHGVVVEH